MLDTEINDKVKLLTFLTAKILSTIILHVTTKFHDFSFIYTNEQFLNFMLNQTEYEYVS